MANLEEAVKKDPKDVRSLVNLARLHGMAYSQKSATVKVEKGHLEQGVWFGYMPALVPFRDVLGPKDEATAKAARIHLAEAVKGFGAAVKLAPKDVAARMGYAWTLKESGERKQSIGLLRALIEEAWSDEKNMESGTLNGETVVTEAAGYLIPLLDKDKDRNEIAEMKRRVAHLRRLSRPITPIAIPLRDGLEAHDLEDRAASVAFDVDGSERGGHWTWITSDAGWLVHDPKGHGRITSGLQLFGNVTFWLFWRTG
jgi:hypothetical protein